MKPRAQTVALAAIGIADLLSTLYFIGAANAAEANPLMARILQWGPAAFIQAKLLMLLIPLIVLELARRKKPEFVARAMNTAIAAYVGLYIVGVAHLNRPPDPRLMQSGTLEHSEVAEFRASLGLPSRAPLSLLDRARAQTAAMEPAEREHLGLSAPATAATVSDSPSSSKAAGPSSKLKGKALPAPPTAAPVAVPPIAAAPKALTARPDDAPPEI